MIIPRMVLLLIVTFVGVGYWKYSECRKVGHGRLYCIAVETGR